MTPAKPKAQREDAFRGTHGKVQPLINPPIQRLYDRMLEAHVTLVAPNSPRLSAFLTLADGPGGNHGVQDKRSEFYVVLLFMFFFFFLGE